MNELHLFAGAGGGILGGILLGHTCVCAVEIEPYCRKVLLQRQRDGILPKFPIWDDVRTFDGRPWRGIVDVVCGGFPCQDISAARSNNHVNGRRRGLDGPKSGLWVEMCRIVREVEPGFVQVENSPRLISNGLGRILGDLASMGFNARWGVLSAGSCGAPHERERIWIVASHPDRTQRQRGRISSRVHAEYANLSGYRGWETEPGINRVDDGTPNRVQRLKAIGNAQVPIVAALAWETLSDCP